MCFSLVQRQIFGLNRQRKQFLCLDCDRQVFEVEIVFHCFWHQDGRLLFCGCKDGRLLMHDFRCRRGKPQLSLEESSGFWHIEHGRDESLYAGCYDDKASKHIIMNVLDSKRAQGGFIRYFV